MILDLPGTSVKRRFLHISIALLGAVFLLSGCGSTGPSRPADLSGVDYMPNGPQTFLSGAQVQYARSLAMGSAVSKGWEIADASDNRLVVRRPLDTAVAGSVVGGPVRTASVEVATGFHQRQGGVDVAVGASVIADRGNEAEERFDFTESYRAELERSLASLRKSWEESRGMITSSTPPPPPKLASSTDAGAPSATPAVQAWQTAVTETTPVQGNEAIAAPPAAPTPATPSEWVFGDGADAAPVEDRFAAPPPASVQTGAPAPSPDENLLVLDRSAELGVWSYYAEHYAKIRGCDVSSRGAVLELKQSDSEIHRVACENGESLLVKCNAGTCIGIE